MCIHSTKIALELITSLLSTWLPFFLVSQKMRMFWQFCIAVGVRMFVLLTYKQQHKSVLQLYFRNRCLLRLWYELNRQKILFDHGSSGYLLVDTSCHSTLCILLNNRRHPPLNTLWVYKVHIRILRSLWRCVVVCKAYTETCWNVFKTRFVFQFLKLKIAIWVRFKSQQKKWHGTLGMLLS